MRILGRVTSVWREPLAALQWALAFVLIPSILPVRNALRRSLARPIEAAVRTVRTFNNIVSPLACPLVGCQRKPPLSREVHKVNT
jgi:hypothetical protein